MIINQNTVINKNKENKIKFWKVPYPLSGNLYFWGRVGCLDENTQISIYNEDRKIKKILLKDLPDSFDVISYNFNTSKKEIKPAIKIDSGEKECYEIEFENGVKISASEDHKFFNAYGEIQLKDIKENDCLLFDKNCNYIGWRMGLNKYTDIRIKEIGLKEFGRRTENEFIKN